MRRVFFYSESASDARGLDIIGYAGKFRAAVGVEGPAGLADPLAGAVNVTCNSTRFELRLVGPVRPLAARARTGWNARPPAAAGSTAAAARGAAVLHRPGPPPPPVAAPLPRRPPAVRGS